MIWTLSEILSQLISCTAYPMHSPTLLFGSFSIYMSRAAANARQWFPSIILPSIVIKESWSATISAWKKPFGKCSENEATIAHSSKIHIWWTKDLTKAFTDCPFFRHLSGSWSNQNAVFICSFLLSTLSWSSYCGVTQHCTEAGIRRVHLRTKSYTFTTCRPPACCKKVGKNWRTFAKNNMDMWRTYEALHRQQPKLWDNNTFTSLFLNGKYGSAIL